MLNAVHVRPQEIRRRAIRRGAILLGAMLLLLTGCNNTYGPPPNGRPTNWGQQHYLDVQRQREQNENRMNF